MKDFFTKNEPYILSFIMALVIGPFAFIPLFIYEENRFKKGKTPMLLSDEFATCAMITMVTSLIWATWVNWAAHGGL